MKKLESQNHVRTLPDIFEFGLQLSRDKPFLGHRPQISSNPVKFADHYVWATYAQVDERRRDLGSALHHFFAEGVIGGGDLATVGIWSQNRPGTRAFGSQFSRIVLMDIRIRCLQNGR